MDTIGSTLRSLCSHQFRSICCPVCFAGRSGVIVSLGFFSTSFLLVGNLRSRPICSGSLKSPVPNLIGSSTSLGTSRGLVGLEVAPRVVDLLLFLLWARVQHLLDEERVILPTLTAGGIGRGEGRCLAA